jgi:hypothetical protein
MATSLTFTGALLTSASFLVSSSQLTPIVIAQGGENGARIYSIAVSTNSSTAANHLLGISGSNNGTIARLGVLAVPANSGHTAGTAVFDFFGNALFAGVFQKQKDANGVPYYNIPPNTFLTIQTSASVFLSAGSTSSIHVNGEFY